MDPVSALAFASSIFATIDFSAKVLKGAYDIYKSGSDATEEEAQVKSVVEELQAATSTIEMGFGGSSPHEIALTNLAKRSALLSRDILKTLNSTRVQGNKSKWRILKASLKSAIKAGKIESLMKRVQSCRSEIILQLNLLLVDQTSSVKGHLDRIEKQGRELENETCSRFDDTQTKLRDILVELQSVNEKERLSRLEDGSVAIEVRDSLKSLISMTKEVTYENTVLARLYFPSLHWREDAVSESAPHTFHWIIGLPSNYNRSDDTTLDDTTSDDTASDDTAPDDTAPDDSRSDASVTDDSSLGSSEVLERQWERDEYAAELKEEGSKREEVSRDFIEFLTRRNGIFFLAGKAGCGKSTLLKYIQPSSNRVVKKALDHWATTRQRRLIFIPIFFWAAGDTLQKSMEGFYRTLLFQLLRQCPEIMRSAFPQSKVAGLNSSFNEYPFRLPEIMVAMSRIPRALSLEDYCLCLFIDGLDEYEGDKVDRIELARSLSQWADHPFIKILCSARPYPEFLDTFQKSASATQLHELTRGDIALYGISVLRREQKRRLGPESAWTSQHGSLVRCIVQRSEGIFIWARAVVRFLSSKIGHLGPQSLVSLLDETPQSLYDLYRQMLAKREPMAKHEGNKMLLLAIKHPGPQSLNALAYSWLDRLEDCEFPLSSKPTCYSQAEIEQRINLVREGLGDGTAGLLEIRKNDNNSQPFFQHRVEPIHRTARDFLINDWSTTEALTTDAQFPQMDTYWRIHLAEVKFTLSIDFLDNNNSVVPFPHLYDYCYLTGGLDHDQVPINQIVRFNKDFETVIGDYQDLLDSIELGERVAMRSLMVRIISGNSRSFSTGYEWINIAAPPLQLALYFGQDKYFEHEIATNPRLFGEEAVRASLLLACCLEGKRRLAEILIDSGTKYSWKISVRFLHDNIKNNFSENHFTLWVVLLRMLSSLTPDYLTDHAFIAQAFLDVSIFLEETLQTHDSDWDAVILVDDNPLSTSPRADPHYYVPQDEFTIKKNPRVKYIELESLLELLVCAMKAKLETLGPRDDKTEITKCLERLVSFQASRTRITSQRAWHQPIWDGVAGWWPALAQTPNQLTLARNTYCRANLENLRKGKFLVYGVITKTERFVGDFEVKYY
ncbi:hypothetical protein HD806DRAFT_227574 [Xylariaceae sp. AK1471]|nr:hypothetical protein HD806DRAFT_227574 [Xylariaceae sp. AK1471]